jgi:serine/threonine protein kinase/formylglycine-generating enzyme required for sulfatase activity
VDVRCCPEREQLQEYVTGDLASHLCEAIDLHLGDCPRCRGAVRTLDEESAPLAHWLRPVPVSPPDEGPLLRRLAARAKALAAPEPTEAVRAEDSPRTTSQFIEQLGRTGLLPADELTALLARPGGEEGPRGLARELVSGGRLTEYQASELLEGRGDGLVLGNYVLLEPAGAGGMGRVYRAWHRRMKRAVALKVVAPELLRSPAARARFQREVEAVARLSHPHIVSAFDAAEDCGRHFLVMEYVAGRGLDALVKSEGPLRVERAISFLLQAARGLAHAHAAGVVHRDVKPSNLLVDAHDTVKVLDLGLARVAAEGGQTAGDLTSQDVVLGTASYMAPEQATDPRRTDARADVYGLGCSLHFLLTGEPPYRGATALETVLAHREQPIPSLRARRPDCPPALDALFHRMIAKRPEDRPVLPQVIAELETLRAESTTPPPSGARAGRRFRAPILALAAIAAAALLWLVFRNTLDKTPGETPAEPSSSPPRASTQPKPPGRPEKTSLAEAARGKGKPAAEFAAVVKGRPAADFLVAWQRSGPGVTPQGPVLDMVRVEKGTFQMGSDDKNPHALPDERSRHRVEITQPFRLGKYEVTQEQYQLVMGVNPSKFAPSGRSRERVKGVSTASHPVDSVRWIDAITFCNRLSERHRLKPYYCIKGEAVSVLGGDGYRLPTEAEWEYAGRAGSETSWSFGDDIKRLGEYAWHSGNSNGLTHAVGTRKPNPLGLYDMHGNVPEWCWDRYDANYYRKSPVNDPPGSGEGTTRVYRGGGWNDVAGQTRSAARSGLGVFYGSVLNAVGFRVARNIEPDR